MKFKQTAILALAALAMAAAPAAAQQAERPSAWSRVVEGTKNFARNPFGLFGHNDRGMTRGSGDATPRLRQPAPLPGYRAGKSSAFLPESIAADRAAQATAAEPQDAVHAPEKIAGAPATGHRDPRVQRAAYVEQAAPPDRREAPVKRTAWFLSDDGRAPTVSEYMAQEKP